MHVKLIEGKKMPRMITVPELYMKEYRELQAGKTALVKDEAGQNLIDRCFCTQVDVADKKKGAAKDGVSTTD